MKLYQRMCLCKHGEAQSALAFRVQRGIRALQPVLNCKAQC
uniref:Uncharacterized protein n=1 Tax=Anguilla anguilla TaxID=7936 RepID=A0A0E9VKZ6_ANGAN